MFTHFLEQLKNLTTHRKFCIALSGGLDSRVLLHLFSTAQQEDPALNIRAIHIHHGLSKFADKWSSFCQKICESCDIPFTEFKVTINKEPQRSLEEMARQKRYEIFREVLQVDEALVTAHHQNDQAETLLLQLFRGAGLKGLSAMPSRMHFGQGQLLRPLLRCARKELYQYANENKLQWINDESNEDKSFDRNFVRHELLPIIIERWPEVVATISRTAEHCSEANHYIDKTIAEYFKNAFNPTTQSLFVPALLQLDDLTQRYVIRYWLSYLKFLPPSTLKMREIQRTMLLCRYDATSFIQWNSVELRRYANEIYAMKPLQKHDSLQIIKWDLKKDLHLSNAVGFISIQDLIRQGLVIDDLNNVTIRFRQGGEKCRIKNRKFTHSLKKLFQEWRVPPWQRDRIPLLYSDNTLKAIVGFAVCE